MTDSTAVETRGVPAGVLGKVAAFITRRHRARADLLLIRHPYAGLQLPAGTIEENETPLAAAYREAQEETGLTHWDDQRLLGIADEQPPQPGHYVLRPTAVYARPDATSSDWAWLRRGITVRRERRCGDWVQVTYREWDDYVTRAYVTCQITGWAPAAALADAQRRFYFHLQAAAPTADDAWTVRTDNHTFTLFWAPVADLPSLVPPQQAWLDRFLPWLTSHHGDDTVQSK